MRKTLGSIIDTERCKMKFSQGDLKIPYDGTQEPSKSSLPERKYITCFCFLKSAQQYFDNLKARLFEIINYIPKII